jgi:hypothetical protein
MVIFFLDINQFLWAQLPFFLLFSFPSFIICYVGKGYSRSMYDHEVH